MRFNEIMPELDNNDLGFSIADFCKTMLIHVKDVDRSDCINTYRRIVGALHARTH